MHPAIGLADRLSRESGNKSDSGFGQNTLAFTLVYADTITGTEQDDNAEETDCEIHFMKGYTVFNVGQIAGCLSTITESPRSRGRRWSASAMAWNDV
jgi:hypothetical protein